MTTPPYGLTVASCEVHVWSASLDERRLEVEALTRTLSSGERRRSDAYRSTMDRTRFVVCRGLLRRLLARYTDAAPGALGIRYEAAGKPELVGEEHGNGLRFNVSHTGGTALFALARGRRVGIDVEALRPIPDLHDVARMTCSARERRILDTLAPSLQLAAFFRAWTRKEAVLKALGRGLRCPPESVEVTLAPDEPARVVALDGARTCDWSLSDVQLGRDTIAAVAVERRTPGETMVVRSMGGVDA